MNSPMLNLGPIAFDTVASARLLILPILWFLLRAVPLVRAAFPASCLLFLTDDTSHRPHPVVAVAAASYCRGRNYQAFVGPVLNPDSDTSPARC
jgi:hypothetical protein